MRCIDRGHTSTLAALGVAATLLAGGCAGQHSTADQSSVTTTTSPRSVSAQSSASASECGADDAAMQHAITAIPKLQDDMPWYLGEGGHTGDCSLAWVFLDAHGTASTPGQLVFFHDSEIVGTAAPEPRPYLSVIDNGQDTVTVQFEWPVGNDPNCCPTGRATVRYQLSPDGRAEPLDPLPAI